MLWSGDADPRLVASENFRGVQEFKAWLVDQAGRWFGLPITVQWTARLIDHKPLVDAITAVLVGQSPPAADTLPAQPWVPRPVDRRN
jgi:hypothetical protein